MLFILTAHECQHDIIAAQTPKRFLNDLTDGRLLQSSTEGKLRIFVDYTQVTVGGET